MTSNIFIEELCETNGPRTVVQLLPFDSEQSSSLGGLPPWSGLDRVDTETSYYKSLARMSTLPFPPRTEKIKDEELKEAYIRMCFGDFVAAWAIGGGPQYNGETLTLEAGLDGETMVIIHLYGTADM